MQLGQCPVCQEVLAYSARICPHCGHPFDVHGSFGAYLEAEQVRQAQVAAEAAAIHAQQRTNRYLFYFVLLIVALGIGTFLYFRHGLSGLNLNMSANGVSSQSSSPATPSDLAVATVEQYYNDINNHDYKDARVMWANQNATLADFEKGYGSTLHDDLTVNSTVQQADGTVKVFITIVATEKTPSGGTQQNTYQLYYIVGQQNGQWILLGGGNS